MSVVSASSDLVDEVAQNYVGFGPANSESSLETCLSKLHRHLLATRHNKSAALGKAFIGQVLCAPLSARH